MIIERGHRGEEAFCRFDMVLIEAQAEKEAGGGQLIWDAYR
jgi:hypothetical protein